MLENWEKMPHNIILDNFREILAKYIHTRNYFFVHAGFLISPWKSQFHTLFSLQWNKVPLFFFHAKQWLFISASIEDHNCSVQLVVQYVVCYYSRRFLKTFFICCYTQLFQWYDYGTENKHSNRCSSKSRLFLSFAQTQHFSNFKLSSVRFFRGLALCVSHVHCTMRENREKISRDKFQTTFAKFRLNTHTLAAARARDHARKISTLRFQFFFSKQGGARGIVEGGGSKLENKYG